MITHLEPMPSKKGPIDIHFLALFKYTDCHGIKRTIVRIQGAFFEAAARRVRLPSY